MPKLPDRWRRNYAHIRNLDVMCPRCGFISVSNTRQRAGNRDYDRKTSRFHCPRCRWSWIVGVLLWPVINGPANRPADQSPSPAEGLQLRRQLEEASAATDEKPRREEGPERRPIYRNRVCTCGLPCLVHGPVENGGNDDTE